MTLSKTRSEFNNAVFSPQYHVAKEEGYFEQEGFDVDLVPAGSGRDRDKEVLEQSIEDHRQVKSYGWHEGIEKGEFRTYRACEWGQIRARRTAQPTPGRSASARRCGASHRGARRFAVQPACRREVRGGNLMHNLGF